MLIDVSFDYIVVLIILVSMLTQIFFGVGVLLWGTPSLILLGYEFTTALSLLLPISMAISGLQATFHYQHIDRKGISKFIKFSLPLAVVGLVIVISTDIKIEWSVFGALVLGGLLRLTRFHLLSNKLSDFKDFMLPLIGIVHGISNLGGALLVVWVSLSDKTKLGFRSTVASCYFLLALFQIVTVIIYKEKMIFFISYFIFGVAIYVILDKSLMRAIKDNNFDTLLTCLIFLMAILLGLKAASII